MTEGLKYFKGRISKRLKSIKIVIANKSGQIEEFLKRQVVYWSQIKSFLQGIKEQSVSLRLILVMVSRRSWREWNGLR